MGNFWQILTASFAAITALLGHSSVSIAPPPTPDDQSAIISQNIASLVSFAVISNTSTSTPTVKSGLLPKLKFKPFKVAGKSTTTVAITTTSALTKSTSTPVVTPASKISPATIMSAQAFLAATTVSFKEQREGPFDIDFMTNIGGGQSLAWTIAQATVGGTTSFAPQFSTSYSCDPPLDSALFTSADPNPTAGIRAAYDCTVTLTPLSGTDRRAQSKDFSFTTPAGQMIIAPPSSMNVVLKNDENDGGFVFNNEDTKSVTISALNVDVSYTALVGGSPIVLRVADPVTGLSLYDYHLENVPLDPGSTYTHTITGLQIPFSVVIGPQKEKLLPVEVLGVERMSVTGVNPTITVTLRSVTTNPFIERLILTSAQISWSCVVPMGSYDPNATSGAFAAGNACLH